MLRQVDLRTAHRLPGDFGDMGGDTSDGASRKSAEFRASYPGTLANKLIAESYY